ncbi:MAG: outer membrane protein assembly factor BamE [Candidatus Saccharibacteria bacterium]|nr:outer membrane protein assembly factor BamE [Candidatus Saccharibacteria bacterium]
MDPNNPGVLGNQPAPAPAPTPTPEPMAAPVSPAEPVTPAPEPVMAAAPAEPVAPVLGAQPAPAPAPMGTPAAPAPKKSNVGLIIAIIVAVLIVAGGIVAAILILNNNKGGSDDKPSTSQTSNKDDDKDDDIEDEDENEDEGEDEDEDEDEDDDKPATIKKEETKKDDTVAASGTYKDNSAYFININGTKYNFNNKISDLAKSGYEADKRIAEQGYTVKPNQYLILIGASQLTNKSVSTGISFTPYNDGTKEVAVKDAKLGSVTVRAGYSESDKKAIEKITFNGGLHIGSTREQVVKVFGAPTKTNSYDNNYEYIEYTSSTYKYYKFTIKDGVVSEITWENFGSLVH